MIPYEELAAALAHWRTRNGLPTGAAEYLGEMAPMAPMSFEGYVPAGAQTAPMPEEPQEIDLGAEALDYVEEVEPEFSEGLPVEEIAVEASESQFVEEYLSEYEPEPAAAVEALDPSSFGGTQQVWGGNLGAEEDAKDPPAAPPKGGRKKSRKR